MKILGLCLLLSSSLSFAEGLKKINYENQTSETKSQESAATASPSLSKEQTDQLMKELEVLKKRQEESQKILDDLEKEE